jgi:hypothetical protein
MLGIISFARGLSAALLLAVPLLTGCDGGDEATFQCTGTTPPAQACCAYGQAVVDYCNRCNPNRESDCVESVMSAIDVASFGEGCEGADGIRDETQFYDQCLPEMAGVSCDTIDPPASCQDQILYEL